MSPAREPTPPEAHPLRHALDALTPDELRARITRWCAAQDEPTRDSLLRALRAAPPEPSLGDDVARYVAAATRAGVGSANEARALLSRADAAYEGGAYAEARRAWEALFGALAAGAFSLDGAERAGDALPGLDRATSRYLVSVYETSPASREPSVWDALAVAHALSPVRDPLAAMASAAPSPLAGFDDFAQGWTVRLEYADPSPRTGAFETEHERWLREAVARTRGADGLRALAMRTGRPAVFDAWISALRSEGRADDALSATATAMLTVRDGSHRARYAERRVRLALSLGRTEDAHHALRDAWRAEPTVPRLLRVATFGDPPSHVLVERVRSLQVEVPASDERLAGVVALVLGSYDDAVRILAASRGLGWSDPRHAGHALFAAVAKTLLGRMHTASSLPRVGFCIGVGRPPPDAVTPPSTAIAEDDALPPLPEAHLGEVLDRALRLHPVNDAVRRAMLDALRKAALRRAEESTSSQRRSAYDHAASLVTVCAEAHAAAGDAQGARMFLAMVQTQFRGQAALIRTLHSVASRSATVAPWLAGSRG